MLAVYLFTLSPSIDLDFSGIFATGAMYGGVPHPPGYPVWTIYTWLFTVLVPVSNIAWRVALSSAVAGAFACGMIGLVTSRSCSLIVEGIEAFKELDKRWENWLCGVAGFEREACLRLALLVEELFANTVAHGHGQDSDAPVRIAFDVEPGRVRLLYEDTGPAHDPFASVTPPDDAAEVEERPVGGLGVVLIAAMAKDVEYRRSDGVNRIALVVMASR